MSQTNLLTLVEDYVFSLYKEKANPNLLFHDFKHSADVVEEIKKLAAAIELAEPDVEILIIAGLFHDTGYLEQRENHEEISAAIAKRYLEAYGMDAERIKLVEDCILATAMHYQPKNIMQRIIRDAEMINLSNENYFVRAELLREEKKALTGVEVDDIDWLKEEVEFLKSHSYYTKQAQVKHNQGKSKNILIRQKEFEKAKSKTDARLLKNEGGSTKGNDVPQRSIDTMFSVTLRNHINISAIADNKANILLTINALIISITVSALIPNYNNLPHVMLPTGFLLLVCLTTIIFATLSTSPKITKGVFTKADVASKKANLLFFGNFFNSKLDDFEWGMGEMMKDKDFLYGAMIRDLHALGGVLFKKFYYLRLAYMMFMYGMIATVIFFGFVLAKQ